MTEPKTTDLQRATALKASLNNSDQSIRFNAALDLAQMGDADAIPVLIEGFQADSFVTRLFHAGKALAAMGEVAVPALSAALTSDVETVRVDTAYTLWQIDPTRAAELLPVAVAALRNWNPDLSLDEQMKSPLADAVFFIGALGTAAREVVPVLVEMLRTPVRRDDPLAWPEDMRTLFYLI